MYEDYIFRSEDRCFELKISNKIINKFYKICDKSSHYETGGILIGYYSNEHKTATLCYVTGPTSDSIMGRTTFRRGIQGLQKIIDKFWDREKQYYLGEWHYHPFSYALPSVQDDVQMFEIAKDIRVNCPEAILVLIGGDPKKRLQINSFIYNRIKKKIKLQQINNNEKK